PAFPSPPAPPSATTRTVYLIDKPGAAQSVVRIGHVGPARTTPDWFALVVLNTIVGGAFTSRLNQNLRETHGYTYGAFSQFAPRRLNGRSEERRVGKECRSRWGRDQYKKKDIERVAASKIIRYTTET